MSDDRKQIKRALISVYDKTGLEELARTLDSAGVEIVSTGSTAAKIADLGINVTPVESLTGFPECLEGRVKTLHPRVHAGILADTRKPDHLNQLEELEIEPFQLVVVNLYPFKETVASGADFDGCVEQIDIGGPSMVRAAAKNHPSVAVVVDPACYGDIAEAVKILSSESHNDVIVTLGPEGSLVYSDGIITRHAGEKTVSVDTVGAGDCHLGTYMACRARGYDRHSSLRVADHIASRVIMVHGPTLDDSDVSEEDYR